MNEFEKAALKEAELSPCKKRKVGAVIVDSSGRIITGGHNNNGDNPCCEDESGFTLKGVVHAEIQAINNLVGLLYRPPLVMYVTQPPCLNCLTTLADKKISPVVVGQFMKFDGSKDRYDLIPPSALEALAKVLTYGARKYKPNNWRECEDIARYQGAAMRHFEAYRRGQYYDEESGMPHLWHAITNVAFLLELDAPIFTAEEEADLNRATEL